MNPLCKCHLHNGLQGKRHRRDTHDEPACWADSDRGVRPETQESAEGVARSQFDSAKRLDSESRREAARLLQAVTPLRFRMVRFRPLSKYADERGQSHPAKASHSSEGGRNVDRPMSLNIP